jgi:hypothetical protein
MDKSCAFHGFFAYVGNCWRISNDNFSYQFGNSVSISGDYAVVGATGEDGGLGDPFPYAGAAYIFHRTGTNTWDTGTKIVATDAQAIDYFGTSVSNSGDYAIVGTHLEDGGEGDPMSNTGAAYLFD